MNIRIAIADDHTVIAEGISKILARYAHITIDHHYTSGKALLSGLQQQQPDVLLLDIQFPDISGHLLARTIVPLYPHMKILVISSLEDPFDVQDMLREGCLGYVRKTVSSATLVHAIETVYRGERFLEQAVKDRIWETMLDPGAREPIRLNDKEQEILDLICQGYSSVEIGKQLSIGRRSVDKYKTDLLHKFGVSNTVILAKLAIKYNFVQ